MKTKMKNLAWTAVGAVVASGAWAVFSGAVNDFIGMRQSAFSAASQETTDRLEKKLDAFIAGFGDVPEDVSETKDMFSKFASDLRAMKQEQNRLDALTKKLNYRQDYMWDTLGQLCSLEPSIDCAFRNAVWPYQLPYQQFFTLSASAAFELDSKAARRWTLDGPHVAPLRLRFSPQSNV